MELQHLKRASTLKARHCWRHSHGSLVGNLTATPLQEKDPAKDVTNGKGSLDPVCGNQHSPKSLRLFVGGGPRRRFPSALGATDIPLICRVPGNGPGVCRLLHFFPVLESGGCRGNPMMLHLTESCQVDGPTLIKHLCPSSLSVGSDIPLSPIVALV